MHSVCSLLVICLVASWWPLNQAIRVDWGTNTGPIVPPPPRTTPAPPRQPYREPAPVWEDQSDDVPNPNPYVYVLPPPSRPRTWVIPAGPYAPPNYNNQPPKPRPGDYGQLVGPYSTAGTGAVTGTVSVPALAAQYVPGVGIKYTAIAPGKLQGKYNAKTKKYKAYEKVKYANAPWNYLQLLPLEEKALDWQAPEQKAHAELPQESFGSSTTAAPSTDSSTSNSRPTAESTTSQQTSTTHQPTAASTTAITTTTTTTTTTTAAPTVAAATSTATTATATAAFANYKLAHEKSAYLKKHNKLKKLLEQLEAQGNASAISS